MKICLKFQKGHLHKYSNKNKKINVHKAVSVLFLGYMKTFRRVFQKRSLILIALILFLAWPGMINRANGQSTIFYAESEQIIANPERGLQKYSITDTHYNTRSNYTNLSPTTLEEWRNGPEKITVLFRYFLLDTYLNDDISETFLDNVKLDFDIIRNNGFKCIVRFSYSNRRSPDPQQPSKATILRHLDQLKPILFANKDIILTHQAGFIGTWGEWYYTNSFEFGDQGKIDTDQWRNRKEVIDAMLASTPLEIPLQVRYPAIKKTMYGDVPLDLSTAYQNTPNARIGFYNDAFLNNWGDMGTYRVGGSAPNPVGSSDYRYLANETRFTPMTGETNGVNMPRTDGKNAAFEMDSTNWTCLNRDYYTQNWNNWINSGHYNEILRRLGYRLVLESSTFNLKNNDLSIEIRLKNVGFARLFKQRHVYLILMNTGNNESHTIRLESDPRTWEDKINIRQSIDITSLPKGVYESYLYLPDISTNLSDRPEYAVRFANDNTWNENSGLNKLSQRVQK
jgi:hypothetical protein